MNKSSPINFLMVAIMAVAIGLLIFTHAHPATTLGGMLIGVFVLVVLLDGGSKSKLSKTLGPAVQEEISKGQIYKTDISTDVLALVKDGKRIEAIKRLRELRQMNLLEAKNVVDEISFRMTMGQSVQNIKQL